MSWELLLASPVIIAVIAGVFAVLQSPRLKRIESDAAETKVQVTNDHQSNMRDDITSIDTKLDRLTELLMEHINAASKADTARDERVNGIVRRLNDELGPEHRRRRWWRR